MSKKQSALLEYFWNAKRQEIRCMIPKEVIYFLEAEHLHKSLTKTISRQVDIELMELERKGYVKNNSTTVSLTPLGTLFLNSQHPNILMYWERLIQLVPPTTSLIVSLIGLIASIFGIIQFIPWIIEIWLTKVSS